LAFALRVFVSQANSAARRTWRSSPTARLMPPRVRTFVALPRFSALDVLEH